MEAPAEAVGGAEGTGEGEGVRDARADGEPAACEGVSVGDPEEEAEPAPPRPGEAEPVALPEALGKAEGVGASEGLSLGVPVPSPRALGVPLPLVDTVRAAPILGEPLLQTVAEFVAGAAEGVLVPPEAHAVEDSEGLGLGVGGAGEELPLRVPPPPSPSAVVPETVPVEEAQGLREAEGEADGEGEREGERVSLLLCVSLALAGSLALFTALALARADFDANELEAEALGASEGDAGDREAERVPPRGVAEAAGVAVPLSDAVRLGVSLCSGVKVAVALTVTEGAPAPEALADKQRDALSVPEAPLDAESDTDAEAEEVRQRLGETVPDAGVEALPEALPETEGQRVALELPLPREEAKGEREALGEVDSVAVPRAVAERLAEVRAEPVNAEADTVGEGAPESDAESLSVLEEVGVREGASVREALAQLDGEGEALLLRLAPTERLARGDAESLKEPVPEPLTRALRELDCVLEVEGEPDQGGDVEGEPDALPQEVDDALRVAGLPDSLPLREALREGAPLRDSVALPKGEGEARGEALGRALTLDECDAALEAERLTAAVSVRDSVAGAVGAFEILEEPLLVNEAEQVALDDWLGEGENEGVREGTLDREGDGEAEVHAVPHGALPLAVPDDARLGAALLEGAREADDEGVPETLPRGERDKEGEGD